MIDKIKNDYWLKLSCRVVALFLTAMLVSYAPPYLRGFFDDVPYECDKYGNYSFDFIDDKWDWGFRHYLYWLMCVVLFLIHAARLISWIFKNEKIFKP